MTLTHRIRAIASIAGSDRLARLDELYRHNPRWVRPLLEATAPATIAESIVHLYDALGIESEAHARRLAAWTRLLGRAVGIGEAELDQAELGALMHDAGKICVPDAILDSPLTLGPSELDLVRMHASLGHGILFGVAGMRGAASLVLAHHEYWDGSGYPDGLRGERIPLAARVFALVDSYDAMIRLDRPFRDGVPHAEAAAELEALAGTKYDPRVVAAFLAIEPHAWTAVYGRHPDERERALAERSPRSAAA